MTHFTLGQLPAHMRAQAEAKLALQPKAKRRPCLPVYKGPSNPTGKLLWHMRLAKIPDPVREFEFHGTRKWRFDMAWPKDKVAVEVEGLTHEGGRHQRMAGYTADCRKYNEAQLMGWTVLRFTQELIRTRYAIDTLERVFLDKGDS